jgi:hypothetical protein
MVSELWLPVPGYEETHAVSGLGEVKRFGRWTKVGQGRRRWDAEKILVGSTSPKGYRKVQLWRNGQCWDVSVHQLVLLAFEGPCPEGLEIRHLDGVPGNCRWANLVYGTHKQNCADRDGHGRTVRGERSHLARLTEGAVLEVRARCEAGEKQRVVAAEYKISEPLVSAIVTRRVWRHI